MPRPRTNVETHKQCVFISIKSHEEHTKKEGKIHFLAASRLKYASSPTHSLRLENNNINFIYQNTSPVKTLVTPAIPLPTTILFTCSKHMCIH